MYPRGAPEAGAVYANQPRQTPGLPENKQFSGNNTDSVLRDQPALLPHSILSTPTCLCVKPICTHLWPAGHKCPMSKATPHLA